MNVEIGTEAAQFLFWEYINGNFFAVQPCVVVVVQIKLPLCQVDLAQVVNEWKDVESNKEDDQYLGDICFSLRYVPTSGKVSALYLLRESLSVVVAVVTLSIRMSEGGQPAGRGSSSRIQRSLWGELKPA